MTCKSRKIHAILWCAAAFLSIQGALGKGSSFWGHNAIGIRLSNRRSLRLTADASQYPLVRNAFSIREKSHVYDPDQRNYYDESEEDDFDEDPIFKVDFGNGQASEPTISVAAPTPRVSSKPSTGARGGSARDGSAALAPHRPLVFWENMVCGAISRSIAQTVMHPANTMKTILQSYRGATDRPTIMTLSQPKNFRLLTRGAGANFLLSVPHGAVNFAVLEFVRTKMSRIVESNPTLSKNSDKFGPGLDFLSSAISTICCSVVSTPQMMITDNIMAGNYPNLPKAVTGLASDQGLKGFYRGWWPGLAGKIPSYALTWTFFQELKAAHLRFFKRPPKDLENSIMGCIASATTVCIMIPMDTIKTRLVTQSSVVAAGSVPYKGIIDCAIRIAKEEGVGVFYRGLPPRLVSVVPMIGIQFGVYEFMKKVMLNREVDAMGNQDSYGKQQSLEEAFMEVAASPEQPYPAPQFHQRYNDAYNDLKDKLQQKSSKKRKTQKAR